MLSALGNFLMLFLLLVVGVLILRAFSKSNDLLGELKDVLLTLVGK
jgi:hypothetical protein